MNFTPLLNLTDTHAHLDYAEYDGDREAVIERARQAGVRRIISIGIGRDSIPKTLKLAEKHAELYAAVGVHPTAMEALQPDEWGLLETAARHPRVVAIGETGLDYYHLKSTDPVREKKSQQDYFLRQLDLAKRIQKPAIVHCRDAYDDTLAILREAALARDPPGVMHCFAGDLKTAHRVFDLGYLISVGGVVTFKNAPALRELVEKLPPERLVLETDCPYLAPTPHRGKRNEPAYMRLVAEKVAELWKLPLEKTCEQVEANVRRVFRREGF